SAVLLADVRSLLVDAAGIDDLEEIGHELLDPDDRRIESSSHAFRVPVVRAVEALTGAVRPPGLGGRHSGQRLEEGLHSPQAAAGQIDLLAHPLRVLTPRTRF